jgi:hypothetical protein
MCVSDHLQAVHKDDIHKIVVIVLAYRFHFKSFHWSPSNRNMQHTPLAIRFDPHQLDTPKESDSCVCIVLSSDTKSVCRPFVQTR